MINNQNCRYNVQDGYNLTITRIAYIRQEHNNHQICKSHPWLGMWQEVCLELNDHQEEFQPTMIECKGTIAKQLISVLFDPSASLSYVSPKVVDKCRLQSSKF